MRSWDIFDQSSLSEMAKAWPVGSVVKCAANRDVSKRRYNGKWEDFSVTQREELKAVQGGFFYMKITESGRSWLVGKVLYFNCVGYNYINETLRFKTSLAESPGGEFKILEKNDEAIKRIMGEKFYFDGDEDFLLDEKGDRAEIKAGEYYVRSVNFKLTDLYDEPVIYLDSASARGYVCVRMSDLTTIKKDLTKEEQETVIEWFSKQLGAKISIFSDSLFEITTYKVVANRGIDFLTNFEAGNFLNKEQAEKMIEELKKIKISIFETSKLRVVEDEIKRVNLTTLIGLLKANDVKFNMKELLQQKKGTITGKKFGL